MAKRENGRQGREAADGKEAERKLSRYETLCKLTQLNGEKRGQNVMATRCANALPEDGC